MDTRLLLVVEPTSLSSEEGKILFSVPSIEVTGLAKIPACFSDNPIAGIFGMSTLLGQSEHLVH